MSCILGLVYKTNQINIISSDHRKFILFAIVVVVIMHNPRADDSKGVDNAREKLHNSILGQGREEIQCWNKNAMIT